MFPFIVRLGPHSFPHLSLIVLVNKKCVNCKVNKWSVP